jgi:hypothetical protein
MPRKRKAATAPQGDCYEAAVNFVRSECGTRDLDGCPFMIVQAEVRGQGPLAGKTFGHAWALDPESELVYDYSNGRRLVLPQGIYYAIANVHELDNIYEYTWEAAVKQMLRTRHYGPWELVTRSGL